jgi:hypothetical protein
LAKRLGRGQTDGSGARRRPRRGRGATSVVKGVKRMADTVFIRILTTSISLLDVVFGSSHILLKDVVMDSKTTNGRDCPSLRLHTPASSLVTSLN